jgi:hypothetical protein
MTTTRDRHDLDSHGAPGAHGKAVLDDLSPLHRQLRRAGATRQQAAEAIGVTFLMHGGPATIHGPRAYDAFCEFAPDADEPASRHPHE